MLIDPVMARKIKMSYKHVCRPTLGSIMELDGLGRVVRFVVDHHNYRSRITESHAGESASLLCRSDTESIDSEIKGQQIDAR